MKEDIVVTEEQEYIMKQFSRLIGRILTVVDVAGVSGEQKVNMKRLIEDDCYSMRNRFLQYFTEGK